MIATIEPSLITEIRQLAEDANYCLTDELVLRIKDAYGIAISSGVVTNSQQLENEKGIGYNEPRPTEYYRVLTTDGVDTGGSLHYKLAIDGWLKCVNDTLLVAHWLAHLVGLRHQSVHLFLGLAARNDVLFLQIRSTVLKGHGGKFDVTVGGHVAEFEDPRNTVERELREELGLDTKNHILNGELGYLGQYNHLEIDVEGRYREIELRRVYYGIVAASQIFDIHMQRGEVGGIVIMYKDELKNLLKLKPEIIASGLSGSIRFVV